MWGGWDFLRWIGVALDLVSVWKGSLLCDGAGTKFLEPAIVWIQFLDINTVL